MKEFKCEGRLLFCAFTSFHAFTIAPSRNEWLWSGVKISKTVTYKVCLKKRSLLIQLVGVHVGNISAMNLVWISFAIELF